MRLFSAYDEVSCPLFYAICRFCPDSSTVIVCLYHRLHRCLYLILTLFVTVSAFYPILLTVYYPVSSAYIINLFKGCQALLETLLLPYRSVSTLYGADGLSVTSVLALKKSSSFYRFCLIIRYTLLCKGAVKFTLRIRH